MRTVLLFLILSVPSAVVHAENAQEDARPPHADVCIAIDEGRDTLAPQDRSAAVLLLGTQFDLAGRRVVAAGCANLYTVSHIRLGEIIFVTLTGANERREGTAAGLSDLPFLYSQMVRSIVSGRPMTGFNNVDRTNVTAFQASDNRMHTERYGYARLGYGSVFGDRMYGAPSMGAGYRIEVDAFGLDVSFLNLQTSRSGYGSSGATAASWLKLQGLYFQKPTSNASAYLGGGLSWGATNFEDGSRDYGREPYTTRWHGSGLQGELTVGYELPRASTLRIFVEANGRLPFYQVRSQTYSFSRAGVSTSAARRYAPSATVSVGVGWQRHRGGR